MVVIATLMFSIYVVLVQPTYSFPIIRFSHHLSKATKQFHVFSIDDDYDVDLFFVNQVKVPYNPEPEEKEEIIPTKFEKEELGEVNRDFNHVIEPTVDKTVEILTLLKRNEQFNIIQIFILSIIALCQILIVLS
jgi:hypothetical protein